MAFSGAVVERILCFFDVFCCDFIEFDFLVAEIHQHLLRHHIRNFYIYISYSKDLGRGEPSVRETKFRNEPRLQVLTVV